MRKEKYKRSSSNGIRTRHTDITEHYRVRTCFEGCGNSLNCLQGQTRSHQRIPRSVRYSISSRQLSRSCCTFMQHNNSVKLSQFLSTTCQFHASATLAFEKIPMSLAFSQPSNSITSYLINILAVSSSWKTLCHSSSQEIPRML